MIHFYSIYIIFQHFLPRESEFVFHYSNELSNLFNSLIKSKNISFLIIRILQFIWNQIKLLEIQIDQRLLENWIVNIVKISIIKFDKKHFELCIRIAKIVTEDCAKIWKRIQLEGNPTILFVSPSKLHQFLCLFCIELD